MNARLAVRIAYAVKVGARARCATARAIDQVIANWHVAGWRQEICQYEAAKAADENLSRLMAVSRLGGC